MLSKAYIGEMKIHKLICSCDHYSSFSLVETFIDNLYFPWLWEFDRIVTLIIFPTQFSLLLFLGTFSRKSLNFPD